MRETILLDRQPLSWRQLAQVADGTRLELGAAARQRIANARAIVERIVANGERAYGITTGLGALCNVVLAPDQLAKLSSNTLQSHACGVGEPLPPAQVRALLAAQLQNYAHGHSGVAPQVVERLLDFLNLGITPIVPAGGSVGYLTHMAHAALPLIGLGEAWVDGERLPGATALARRGLEPLALGAKDGLSLVNGTPCMTAFLAMALARAERLASWADVVGAMSFEALKGQLAAFDADALAAKPHPGAQQVGANLRRLLAGSANLAEHQGIRTQDALSIRSIPQIHGASRDQFSHIGRQVDIELASATDNPQVFGTADDYRVISQANPHGQSLALAGDLLAISAAELAGVAERRIDRLVNPLVSGLPPFLLENSGVNSGLMIVQYVAAALVAENKILAQPMVVDNFVTSALQEDHLSLATPAALKALKVLDNVETVLAIEYLVAAQALHFFDSASLGNGTRAALAALRARIPPYTEDRVVAPDIAKAVALLRDDAVLEGIEHAVGAGL
jgi:histidine ammonia-lyase